MPTHGSVLKGMAGAVVMLGFVAYGIISSDLLNAPFEFGHVFFGVLVLIAIGMLLWSLHALYSKREAVFGSDGVEVTGHSLFGRENWREAYSGYKGVLYREEVRDEGTSNHRKTVTYQVIELRHDEAGKSLPLFVSKSSDMPRADWEAYAKWFKLPALTEMGGELVTREHEDLDKSIGELAAEGKIAPKLDFSDPPPAGLHVAKESTADGDQLRLTITAARSPIWLKALLLGVPSVMCVVIAVAVHPLVALGVLLFIGLGVLWVVKDRNAAREILITRAKLEVIDSWQKRPSHEMTFDLGEIETITSRDAAKGVTIAGDRTQVEIGSGLSKGALVWLKDFLTSAVATA